MKPDVIAICEDVLREVENEFEYAPANETTYRVMAGIMIDRCKARGLSVAVEPRVIVGPKAQLFSQMTGLPPEISEVRFTFTPKLVIRSIKLTSVVE